MNHCLTIFLVSLLILQGNSKNLKEEKRARNNNRHMIGYFENWNMIKMRDVCDSWDIINIAFAVPVVPGETDGRMKLEMDFRSNYTENEFISDVFLMQQRGKKILVSIGGATGWFSLLSDAAENQFVSDMIGIIDKYSLNGIDIDLEADSLGFDVGKDPDIRVINSPKLKHMTNAIKRIMDHYGSGFMLTWAPETMDAQMGYQCYAGINQCNPRSGCILPMINALRKETSIVFVQLYNSGSVIGDDDKEYFMGTREGDAAMVKMMCNGFYVGKGSGTPQTEATYFAGLRPDQVAFGVPASRSAAGSGFITTPDLQAAFTEANFVHPGIRGFMAWDINIDLRDNQNAFATENRKFLNLFN